MNLSIIHSPPGMKGPLWPPWCRKLSAFHTGRWCGRKPSTAPPGDAFFLRHWGTRQQLWWRLGGRSLWAGVWDDVRCLPQSHRSSWVLGKSLSVSPSPTREVRLRPHPSSGSFLLTHLCICPPSFTRAAISTPGVFCCHLASGGSSWIAEHKWLGEWVDTAKVCPDY